MDPYATLKLENQLCFPLYALSREIIKLYTPLLEAFDLTYTQYVTMMVMWQYETLPFKELAHRLHLDSGTLTPVVKKLEAKGLVTKYRNKDDDRTVTVELTEQGRALKDPVLEVPRQMAEKFQGKEAVLSELKRQLDAALELMNEQVEP